MNQIVRLAILDTYGVRWSRETFVRDLLQNFFDATPDFRDVIIDLDKAAAQVEIRGPVAFDLDLLAYIGATTKNDGRTVGGFGEGFKICALVGVRDFGLTMEAGAGPYTIRVFFDQVSLGKELCYSLSEAAPFPGSFVRLQGCDQGLIRLFEASSGLFRHPGNTKLKGLLEQDASGGRAIYSSPYRQMGEIYYRRQLRGITRFYSARGQRPVTLVHDGVIEELEGNRDRPDLPAAPIAKAIAMNLEPDALHRVFLHLMPYWEYGNEVLSGLLAAALERKLTFDWPREWLARGTRLDRSLVRMAERQGFRIALSTFSYLGMATPTDHYKPTLKTRAPTDLERARFHVVAELYATLLGRPARTRSFEVFDDLAHAAVLGQHLGDKVIVASPLIAGGFDEAASVILHELAHEAGGDESRPFLGRLRRLIDAALHHPEAVKEARRLYGEVTAAHAPQEVVPEAEPVRYAPETATRSMRDHRGVICTLVVPPAFPPTAELLSRVREMSREAGIAVFTIVQVVSGPVGAIRNLAPGLPTLRVGPHDVEEGAEGRADLGFRVRSYGESVVLPSNDLILRALVRAKEEGWTMSRTRELHQIMDRRGRERVREMLGLRLPETPVWRDHADPLVKRDDAVRAKLVDYSGYGGWDLAGLWSAGVYAAGKGLLERYGQDRRDAETVWAEIKALLKRAVEWARRLRREDRHFDDADRFETMAMVAAQGAAVMGYCQAEGEEDGRAEARRCFQAVRDLTEPVLDLEVSFDLKPAILEHTLAMAGLKNFDASPRGLDIDILPQAYGRAVEVALGLQREADEEGSYITKYMLEDRLKPPEEKERKVREAERRRREALGSLEVKGIYEGALARTGRVDMAAEAALREVLRLFPETEVVR